MPNDEIITIDTEQLQLGVFVFIDLGWMDHPFPLNRFKIKSEDQIGIIRELGIKQIRYCPVKSDASPLSMTPKKAMPEISELTTTHISSEIEAMLREKEARKERLEQHREKVLECQKTISNAAKVMRSINTDIFSRPQTCMAAANQMIDGFLQTLMNDVTTVLFTLNDTHAGEEIYVHSVNVSVLATLMAKELKFPPEAIKLIGMGCLFHDIGKLEIPSKVTKKKDALTPAEQSLLQQHPIYGERIALNAKLDPAALAIVTQHHEYCDGSGYPYQLKEDEISLMAQLVTIVNLFDNLCNPINLANALTPHEALSKLFAQYRNKLNVKMLQAFIRFMGIYPPGSIVRLSNDTIGIIVSISSGKALRPTLLIYDPDVPKDEAILLDLQTLPEVNISKAIRPALLEPEIFSYLSPKTRATYFFDTAKG